MRYRYTKRYACSIYNSPRTFPRNNEYNQLTQNRINQHFLGKLKTCGLLKFPCSELKTPPDIGSFRTKWTWYVLRKSSAYVLSLLRSSLSPEAHPHCDGRTNQIKNSRLFVLLFLFVLYRGIWGQGKYNKTTWSGGSNRFDKRTDYE